MTAPARHFDILVIGAGPAGLSAAHVAAKSGVSVGIVDDNPLPGGQIWRQGPRHPPAGEARALLDDLACRSNVTLCTGTRIVHPLADRSLLADGARPGLTPTYARLINPCRAHDPYPPVS